jgi:hypothetical protein
MSLIPDVIKELGLRFKGLLTDVALLSRKKRQYALFIDEIEYV